jgi:hypothetical protein
MYDDDKLPWKEAEAAALADVRRQADTLANWGNAGAAGIASAKSDIAKAEETAAGIQATLFAVDRYVGPYGRER